MIRRLCLVVATTLSMPAAWLACSSSSPSTTPATVADAGDDAEPDASTTPGPRCTRDPSGAACNCVPADAGNDVECSAASIPNSVCCSNGKDYCACQTLGCRASASSCQCAIGTTAGTVTSCAKPAGGVCCAGKSKAGCGCFVGTCAGDDVSVDACQASDVTNPCGALKRVSKCSL